MDYSKPTRASASAPDPLIGRTVDGYRIDEVLGRGGMGVVYRATQLSLDRPVALKVLPRELGEHPQFEERFRREVDILSKLSHPNVVTVFERGEVDGSPYLVMEYVDGTSLREVVRRGPLPPAEALATVRAVLAALEHAHGKGIVHRDIKPENVLVAPGGIVKVADFGLSRLVGPADVTRLTHTHLLLGTFEYMAPEQREKAREADERSDLYATGVVLYEMLAGELPIGHFEMLSQKRPGECDARIDAIVTRSLEKAPDRRYQRAAEMGADVSRLLSSAGASASAAAGPSGAASRPARTSAGAGGRDAEDGDLSRDDAEPRRGHGWHWAHCWHLGPWGRKAARGARKRGRRRSGMTDEEIAESIRAALNPWAAGSYVAGIWMLALMGVFGTARDERFWLLLSGGCAAIYFFSVVALHRRQLGRLALFTAGVTAATVGAVVALGDTDLRVPAERRFAVVKYDETVMSDDEVERAARDLLDDVDVQVWIKRVVGVRNVDTFPAGVRVAADDGVLEIQVPFSVTWSDATAFDVAVAFAVALEGRHPELRRTQSGSEALQRKLEAAPPVPPRVEPPRPAPGMRDAAVAAPAREGS